MPRPTALKEGNRAPAFTLPASTGENVRLSALQGSNVVLFFYPKDNTPGCSTQAREFQEQIKAFEKAGALVFGVSADGIVSHRKFVDKLGLTFSLLADETHAVSLSEQVLHRVPGPAAAFGMPHVAVRGAVML